MTEVMWVVEWQGYEGPRERRLVTDADQAEATFDEVDRGTYGRVLVDFYRDGDVSGRSLTVAAGGDQSVANYQDSLDPPYFTTLGSNDTVGTADFSYSGSLSEVLGRNLIDKDSAKRALREFVTTGERSSVLTWEEVQAAPTCR
jgi:Immunity protein Imm1